LLSTTEHGSSYAVFLSTSRRKEANRAEAIVRGVGGLIMVAVLAAMVFAMPHLVKCKNTHEMMEIMLRMLFWYAVLGIIIGAFGLVVWLRILKGKEKRRR
jgi:H+/Cl- antiporter ClcA